MIKKTIFILTLISILVSCAGDEVLESDVNIQYAENIVLILGEEETIAPLGSSELDLTGVNCSITEKPSWISIDSSTCILTVTSIKAGDFGPYQIDVITSENNIEIPLEFVVEMPDESTLPTPTNPPAIGKYYQSISLISNSNYIATFSDTGITFMDATNPYAPDVVKIIATGPIGAGAAQALVSTPNHIHAATANGYIITFDWSNLSNPVFLTSILVSGDAGQNYDLATDSINKLFVANTDNNRFSVVDVTDPSNPVVDYTNNSLGSLAAGVTYANGYAYVTAFGGKIFTFGQDSNGDWEVSSEVLTAITQPSRPFAAGKYLLVSKYGGSELDIFSIENKETPVHLETVNVMDNIQVYSRSFIHDNKIYVSTIGALSGKILIYDINEGDSFSLSETLEPKNENGDFYREMSLSLFRNNSFLVMIGLDITTPANREIKTRAFPLDFP